MVTGASTAQASIILIDARNGVVEQTYRHFFINNLLKIKEVIVAVNKMDLVEYSQDVYNNILIDYAEVAKLTRYMPYGGFVVDRWDTNNLKFEWTASVGNDRRLGAAPNFPILPVNK